MFDSTRGPAAVALVAIAVGCGSDNANNPPDAPAPGVPLATLSDEFTSSATLSDWTVRSEFEGGGTDGDVSIENGMLLLRPEQDRHFLDARRGLSLFKAIGSADHPNFVVETQVRAVIPGTDEPPTENFHSAGLIVYPDLSDVRSWVVTNIGRQDGRLGFEDKTTVNNSSQLTLYPTGAEYEGLVRLCVVGPRVTVFTRLPSDATWTERNGFTHSIGELVGAGVMINDYRSGSVRVEGQFDYVRFQDITAAADCTADLN